MFLRELVTLPASQHCATIRINLNLQLRVANQTILSTFRARSVSRPIVPSLRTCKSRKKDKTSDSFRNQNNLCICIYICIKYSEIIKIKYCHRDERYETTVLFLLLIVRFLFDTDYVKHVRIAHAVNLSTMEHTMVYPCNDAYRYYFRC